jgi:ribosomal protein S12 methylthiotransferase accessory factor
VIPAPLARLVDPAAGILLNAGLYQRCLWFSDMQAGLAMVNQSPMAARTLAAGALRSRVFSPAEKKSKSAPTRGAGVSYSEDEAIVRAIGEGVERYCGLILDPSKHEVWFGSYDELPAGERVADITAFKVLSSEDYAALAQRYSAASPVMPLVELRPESRLRWVKVTDYLTGAPAWLPITSVFLACHPFTSPLEYISEPISTGLACHVTERRAMLAGVYEVIERDAIMGMWLKRRSAPRLEPQSCRGVNPAVDRMLSEFARTTYEIVLSDLTTDFNVPVVFAILLSDRRPYTIVGAGCDLDPGAAMAKAIGELFMALVFEAEFRSMNPPPDGYLASDDDVTDLHECAKRYALWDLRDRLEFLVKAPRRDLPPPPSRQHDDDLDELVERITRAGFRAYHCNMTIPEVERAGLHVVKSIIPGVLPLPSHPSHAPRGSSRLRVFDRLHSAPFRFPEPINPWPHPFP